MEEIKSYSSKYKLGEEGEKELIILMNNLMKEKERENIGEIIKKTIEETLKKEEKEKKKKKYKSRKAEEYAEEHGIEIEEFEMNEISKKDVENKIKEKTKKENNKIEIKLEKKVCEKRKVICSGINKKGEACKSTGTINPEGAKKHYCFRHAEDWKSFECESDSSDEELDLKKINNLSDE